MSPKRYRVIYSLESVDELDAVHRYISTGSDEAAPKFIARLLDAVDSLTTLPY